MEKLVTVITEYLKIVSNYGFLSRQELDYLKANKGNQDFINLATKIKDDPDNYIPTVVLGGGRLPCRKYSNDLGLDLFATEHYDLQPGEGNRFYTGIKMALPNGGLLRDKSSSAWGQDGFRGIIVCGGVIDPSYRGELLVVLYNLGKTVFEIRPGKTFVQLIAPGTPIAVTELVETARGEQGFGAG